MHVCDLCGYSRIQHEDQAHEFQSRRATADERIAIKLARLAELEAGTNPDRPQDSDA